MGCRQPRASLGWSAPHERRQPLLRYLDIFHSRRQRRATPPTSNASITSFHIQASVEPPTRLQASADLNVQISGGGERTLLFELSRYLKVDAIESDGRPIDFIQNPAIEGSELRRKGNDLVAVVFPAPLAPGQQLKLRFRYAGDVLSEAGKDRSTSASAAHGIPISV